MKAILTLVLLFVVIFIANAEITNGSFYIDQNIDCQLLAQNGKTTTNRLFAGKTYVLDSGIAEFIVTNETLFYLPSGILIMASEGSTFSIDVFDQDIKNIDASPRKAEIGACNLNLTLTKGDLWIVNNNPDTNSTLTVNTPFTGYQPTNGKFYFRTTDKSAVSFVAEGELQTTESKNETADKGKMSVSIPFSDAPDGVADKVVSSIKLIKQNEIPRFTTPLNSMAAQISNVDFFIINQRVIGIWMK